MSLRERQRFRHSPDEGHVIVGSAERRDPNLSRLCLSLRSRPSDSGSDTRRAPAPPPRKRRKEHSYLLSHLKFFTSFVRLNRGLCVAFSSMRGRSAQRSSTLKIERMGETSSSQRTEPFQCALIVMNDTGRLISPPWTHFPIAMNHLTGLFRSTLPFSLLLLLSLIADLTEECTLGHSCHPRLLTDR
jgi:hypothetical protein